MSGVQFDDERLCNVATVSIFIYIAKTHYGAVAVKPEKSGYCQLKCPQ